MLQQKLSEQGRKAMFALRRNVKSMCLNYVTLLSLFDTYINSLLSYASEIWGAHKAPAIERVHMNYCKNILGVKLSTNNVMIYQELGRLPLIFARKCKIFKYWFKLLNTSNCILKNCYNYLYCDLERCPNNKCNWLYFIKNELFLIGLGDVWYSQNLICDLPDVYFAVIKQRLYDCLKQELDAQVAYVSKMF